MYTSVHAWKERKEESNLSPTMDWTQCISIYFPEFLTNFAWRWASSKSHMDSSVIIFHLYVVLRTYWVICNIMYLSYELLWISRQSKRSTFNATIPRAIFSHLRVEPRVGECVVWTSTSYLTHLNVSQIAFALCDGALSRDNAIRSSVPWHNLKPNDINKIF